MELATQTQNALQRVDLQVEIALLGKYTLLHEEHGFAVKHYNFKLLKYRPKNKAFLK